MVKDWSVEGDEVCSTHYESECWTQNIRKEVSDDVPECLPVVEQICEDVTEGYTSSQKCTAVTRLKCSIRKKVVITNKLYFFYNVLAIFVKSEHINACFLISLGLLQIPTCDRMQIESS